MAEASSSNDPARRARFGFADQLAAASPRLLDAVLNAARILLDKPAERSVAQQRRDNVQALMARGGAWVERLNERLHDAAEMREKPTTISGELLSSLQGNQPLQLVDDASMQREISISRLAQSITDEAVWEYNDLATRVAAIENAPELREHDLFRPQQLAKIYVGAFEDAGLEAACWSGCESALRHEIGLLATEAYHDANAFLVARGVMPEVNLRQLIRRSVDTRSQMVASQQMPLGD
ncbi:MAG TPA: DUF1631 family protein, partial [Burkholderiaceae bacterium]